MLKTANSRLSFVVIFSHTLRKRKLLPIGNHSGKRVLIV